MDGKAHPARIAEDSVLDARGLLCPLPVLKARKRLASLASGQILRLLADDPAAVVDVPFFCEQSGHSLLYQDDETAEQVYLIQKR